MKTRVIQNEPDPPTAKEDQVVAAAEPMRSTNLASRMGRWSRAHGKIAIVILLAALVLAGAFFASRLGAW